MEPLTPRTGMVMEGLPTKSHPKWDWVDNCGTPCTQPVIGKGEELHYQILILIKLNNLKILSNH